MVIGLLRDAGRAALCLDNLAEAEFPNQSISLVMRTRAEVDEIAVVSGPLTGLPPDELKRRLVGLGLPAHEAASYAEDVRRGQVFIAVSVEGADDAAAEMLRDHDAQQVRTLTTA